MQYGELLVARQYYGLYRNKHQYRFRIDPVPFIYHYARWFSAWYKRPRTTQERKMSLAHKEYVRGKRSAVNLPNTWDDCPRSDRDTRRSWKNKKIKKQWLKSCIKR